MTTLIIILLAALTQLGGLIGGMLLIWKERLAHRISTFLLSFAAGTLLGVTFLDLLPETLAEAENTESVFLFTLVGLTLFFVTEKLLLWHHHAHNEEEVIAQEQDSAAHLDAPAVRGAHIQPLVLFGDGLHNFLDGAALALTFSIDWRLGLLTALAIFLHELPHNISDFAILLHTRMPRARVMLWNVLLTLPSPLGAALALLTVRSIDTLLVPLLAVAAGSFLYIALANLMPQIHHEQRPGRILLQVLLFLAGIGLLWFIGMVFPE